MELNLQAQKVDTTVFEGEGGGYYAWTAAKTPAVAEAAVGAGRLVLHPNGFALPHYTESSKIGYVVQGSCSVGLILEEKAEEKVIIMSKGDAIPVPSGAISWWFNAGDSDLIIIFLGETTQSYTPRQFDYFFLTAAVAGFSTNFISKIYGLNDDQSKELVENQPNAIIIKIDPNVHMPAEESKSNCKKQEFVINLDGSGEIVDKVGLSSKLVRVEGERMLEPYYSTADQMIYVTRGGGHIQIVGLNGTRMLDEVVEVGHLIVVPKFFLAALIATHQGLEFLCVSTSPRPLSMQIAGKTSAYKALSSSVLEAALNVSLELLNSFNSKP